LKEEAALDCFLFFLSKNEPETIFSYNQAPGQMMEKRADPRSSASIGVRFFYGNMFYSGTITDISKKGMFINTTDCMPRDFNIVILIHYKNDIVSVNSRVVRLRQNYNRFDGMGIEIIHPKKNYLEFVESLRTIS